MRLYNIEILSKDFVYRSSYQTQEVEYHEDYLAMDSSRAVVPKITAMEGDYIIVSGAVNHAGIVTACEDKGTKYEIQFKPILMLTDVDVHYDRTALRTVSLEAWIAGILNDTFRDNTDSLQNITGFTAVPLTETKNAVMELESNIGNLYSIITEALVKYSVVVDFTIDVSKKTLTACIQAKNKESPVIEADLPNILSRLFVIRQAEKTVNKISVYNENDETEHMDFYMLENGNIVTDSTAAGRISPVVFAAVYIAYEDGGNQEFAEAAYEKAFSSMQAADYNNLIELTVLNNDTLVRPETMEIGQRVKIIRNEIMYETVLTGKVVGKTTKLIFGAVRLELTKQLKRRMQQR
ncbi:MAG: hypothetical protein HDR14_13205 [Lachnospiraceae bacterium]|nr:hypothetical protein [Lachnospiraceae bacterium]